jgi:hypothetical protein
MSIFKNDIGVGIVTCNRPEFFANLANSIDVAEIGELVVYNSGTEDNPELEQYKILSKKNKKTNHTVGTAKNDILRHFRLKDVKHIFIIEDDMLIADNSVFEKYIKTAYMSGIYHFNFHKHGPINKNQDGSSKITNSVDYDAMGEKLGVSFHPHIVGAFSYYYGPIIEHVGYLDDNFVNAMEHVDHSYRIHSKGFTTGFGWWADITDSDQYIHEQDPTLEHSTIRKDREVFMKNFADAMLLFEKKHGFKPTNPKIMPDSEILDYLENLYDTNGNQLEKIFNNN